MVIEKLRDTLYSLGQTEVQRRGNRILKALSTLEEASKTGSKKKENESRKKLVGYLWAFVPTSGGRLTDLKREWLNKFQMSQGEVDQLVVRLIDGGILFRGVWDFDGRRQKRDPGFIAFTASALNSANPANYPLENLLEKELDDIEEQSFLREARKLYFNGEINLIDYNQIYGVDRE